VTKLGDSADKQLDAHAADNFGGKDTNHRAGYGTVTFEGQTYTKLEWLLRAAKLGHTLAAGDGVKLVAHYEQQLNDPKALIAALEKLGADRGRVLGMDVIFLPKEMVDAEHP
jgi:hypothetical protein